MATATAMVRAMADGNGGGYGWRQWQRQWLTAIAMATAMAMETVTAMADGNGDGRWWRQWRWPMVTAMVMANNDGDCNGNGDSNSNRNDYGNSDGKDDRHNNWHKEGLPLHVPAMCSAVAGAAPCLPPLGTKECALPSAVPSGCHCKECLLHFKGEGSWELTLDCFFIFLITCSVYLITLFSPTPIQFLKNPVSLLMVYPSSYHTFCQGKLGQGLQCL